jgi:hypothetical protein
MLFFKGGEKKRFESRSRLIDQEISQSKRFNHTFSILAIEISDSVPRGLSKILPGKTISYHVLEKNLRLYDRIISSSFRKYYVILPQSDKNAVQAVMARIQRLAEKHGWGNISIRTASYPKDGDTSKSLLDKLSE